MAKGHWTNSEYLLRVYGFDSITGFIIEGIMEDKSEDVPNPEWSKLAEQIPNILIYGKDSTVQRVGLEKKNR